MTGPERSPSRSTRKAIGSRDRASQHEVRVARVEAVGDAPARLIELDVLSPDRPLAGQRPVVDGQALGELVGAAFVERGAVR